MEHTHPENYQQGHYCSWHVQKAVRNRWGCKPPKRTVVIPKRNLTHNSTTVMNGVASSGGHDAKWSIKTGLSVFHGRDEIGPYRSNKGCPKPATTIYLCICKEPLGSQYID